MAGTVGRGKGVELRGEEGGMKRWPSRRDWRECGLGLGLGLAVGWVVGTSGWCGVAGRDSTVLE